MAVKKGKQTVLFRKKITITETSSIASQKEAEGTLGKSIDKIIYDMKAGEESWERAESRFVSENISHLLEKSNHKSTDIDYIVAGDLLNQSVGSTFGVVEFNIPVFGVYGACSTFGEALSISASLIESGMAKRIIAGVSSHFCTAERQFRFPLDLGTQRPPSSTWTVTGAGAALLGENTSNVKIDGITTGKIVDGGIKDANNMGAAMAPAAADLIYANLTELNISPSYYDLIITGDLGYIGKKLLIDLLLEKGIDISSNHTDCGIEIYDNSSQDTHSGGSGCACSAVTFSAKFYPLLKKKKLKKILFVPTGALLSQTSVQQGETIPSVAHGIMISSS